MIEVPGYRIGVAVHEAARTALVRAVRAADARPVLLRRARAASPSADDAQRLRREYDLTREAPEAGVLAAIDFLEADSVLVLEGFEGVTLARLLREGGPGFTRALDIAVSLAETVGLLHQRGVIHKDIHPGAILVDAETGSVKLTDFGIATLLPKENVPQWNRLEGTLAYMAPEQTGRMNRSIDSRADLYALGVTLYELFTGRLPFEAGDAMELVHSHIAIIPPSPAEIDETLPQALSDCIMKLLAKAAEDRYQSGAGLQADLERCRAEWRTNGSIQQFPPGARDFSGRFQLPETLYGREREIAMLHEAFERVMEGRREILLVAGEPGIGKSSLVQELYVSLAARNGYFVSGKFDQYQRNVPYSSFIQAFRELVLQLLTESEERLRYWRERLRGALGVNGKVLAAVIPEIELIVGEQPPVPELSAAESQNRFKLVFQHFLSALPAEQHPVVIFLDDLQWADTASLQLLEYLILTEHTPYFFGIGAYRDTEVGPVHPLTLAFETIERAGVTPVRVTVGPLTLDDIGGLIADTLHCARAHALPLAELVLEKTAGNPFFVTQFLTSLAEEGLLAADRTAAEWRWDVEQIRLRNITDNVVDFMAAKVQKLDAHSQELLRLASCIGGTFDLHSLAVVSQQTPKRTADDLFRALSEGLLVSAGDARVRFDAGASHDGDVANPQYKFAHDRVHQAVYSRLDEADRIPHHRAIGRLLLADLGEEALDQHIFDVVNHLNIAKSLVRDDAERLHLAALNLSAGRKAKQSSAYDTAFTYLSAGLDLLREEDWSARYQLVLAVHTEAAEAAYLGGDYGAMERLVDIVLRHAKTMLEKVKVYEVRVEALIAQSRVREAIAVGIPVMRKLGLSYPDKATTLHVLPPLLRIRLAFARRSIESVDSLPLMTDPVKEAVMNLSVRVGSVAYFESQELWALAIAKPLLQFLKHGNAPIAAYVYAGYGVLLAGKLGDVDAGYRFAQLGMRLMERFDERPFRCRILFIFNCLIRPWRDPVRDALEPFVEAYRYGLDVGDLEFAAMSYWHHYHFGLQCGVELRTLARDGEKYDHAIDPLKQETIRQVKNVCHQTLRNLMSGTARPSMLLGDDYDEAREVPARLAANDHFTMYVLHLYKAMLACLFGEARQCLAYAATAVGHLDAVGSLSMATLGMYESLAALQLCAEGGGPGRRKLLRTVRSNQRRMKRWAHGAPMNYRHKYDLVDAEFRALRGDEVGAMRAYEDAIAGAKRSLFLHDEALANERAGLFHLARGRARIARSYLLEARARYAFWGATALADRIADLHRDLLGDLPADDGAIAGLDRAADDAFDGIRHGGAAARRGAEGALDFLSVLKASQAISREIDLEKLLKSMLSLVIENAGAEQGALLLERDGALVLEAEGGTARDSVRVLQALPMEAAAGRFPLSVLHYVNRTRASLVLDDAAKDDRFSADPCLLARPVLSVLCHPILRQGAVVGVVYLENSLSAGAFTQQHLEVLNILSAQMAVSLENATLYRETTRLNTDLRRAAGELEEYNRTLEHRVASRTQEIQTKNSELARLLRQLTETQNQLVMREKLASLGQVTAGVAHEIRNPLNFVLNFAMLSDDLLAEAEDVLAAIPEDVGAPSTAALRDILSQLALNTSKIRENGARADTIVRSMLELSRNKTGARRAVDVNALLEESMNLVYHGFCANDDDFDIAIVKSLDPAVGMVEAVPEDVHRVLLNILDNACYAVQRRRADGASLATDYVPTVTLQTARLDEHVEIRVRDNGPGIPVEIREKIFNPFFTTKPPGQGAGLGLSLAYDIVVQGHRGEMAVESEEGAFTEFVLRLPSQKGGERETLNVER